MNDGPPNINFDKIDFSGFHPLDHSLLECQGYPGGRRRHLEYWWDFKTKPELRAQTLCRLGMHSMTTLWKGRENPVSFQACRYCYKPEFE